MDINSLQTQKKRKRGVALAKIKKNSPLFWLVIAITPTAIIAVFATLTVIIFEDRGSRFFAKGFEVFTGNFTLALTGIKRFENDEGQSISSLEFSV
mmetsp:Transcript_22680/g.25557  ORF Transcript_22680/g.25557 Transcript_22680/m.25557 type:complete len:96 (-) Transcript_22680:3594-3881(-)